MNFEAQDYSYLLGTEGLSDTLLKNHFTLYDGYVKNTNALIDLKSNLIKDGKIESSEFSETMRRFGWEFNGMRLHEYYFENITPGGAILNKDSELATQINEDFGSFEVWETEFRAMAKMRGIGWLVMYFDYDSGKLFNTWIGEHNINHLAGAVPILVVDLWEHAYMTDYGIKKPDYIDVILKNLDWEEISLRFGYGVNEETEEEKEAE